MSTVRHTLLMIQVQNYRPTLFKQISKRGRNGAKPPDVITANFIVLVVRLLFTITSV